MNINRMKLLRHLIIGLGVLFIVVSVIALVVSKRNGRVVVGEDVNLEYWGFNVPEEVMNVLIKKYEKENPNVKINYIEKDFDDPVDYQTLLLNRLKKRTGPDIFRLNATWTSTFYNELSKTNHLKRTDIRHRFYPIVEGFTVSNKDEVIGVPIMYDGLVLYYNKDMFDTAGLVPPTTWGELINVARRLTVRNKGKIIRSGIAMGTMNNVVNASDLIAILMYQNGISIPDDLDNDKSLATFNYYLDFSRRYGFWNDDMPNSLVTFSAQRVAMIFATSDQLLEVFKLNPTLNVGAAKLPQIPDLNGKTTNKTWGTFWVESVSADSKSNKQLEAWKFIDWLSQPEQQIERFNETSKYLAYGEPYSDMSLVNNLLKSKYLANIVIQAPYAITNNVTESAGNTKYVELFRNLGNKFLYEKNIRDYKKLMVKLKEDYLKIGH